MESSNVTPGWADDKLSQSHCGELDFYRIFGWTVPLTVSMSVLAVWVAAGGGGLWASHRKHTVLSSQVHIITQRNAFPQLFSTEVPQWAAAAAERGSASSRSLREALLNLMCLISKRHRPPLKQSRGSFFPSQWDFDVDLLVPHVSTPLPLKVPLSQSHRGVTLTLSLHAYILQILWSVYIVTYFPYFIYLISSLSIVPLPTQDCSFYFL